MLLLLAVLPGKIKIYWQHKTINWRMKIFFFGSYNNTEVVLGGWENFLLFQKNKKRNFLLIRKTWKILRLPLKVLFFKEEKRKLHKNDETTIRYLRQRKHWRNPNFFILHIVGSILKNANYVAVMVPHFKLNLC